MTVQYLRLIGWTIFLFKKKHTFILIVFIFVCVRKHAHTYI